MDEVNISSLEKMSRYIEARLSREIDVVEFSCTRSIEDSFYVMFKMWEYATNESTGRTFDLWYAEFWSRPIHCGSDKLEVLKAMRRIWRKLKYGMK